MNPYMKKLNDYLLQAPMNYAEGESLLEMLLLCYTQANPVENAQIHKRYQELDAILEKLTLEENDQVFALTCDLCEEHTHAAFYEGLHFGVHLVTELLQ